MPGLIPSQKLSDSAVLRCGLLALGMKVPPVYGDAVVRAGCSLRVVPDSSTGSVSNAVALTEGP